jgi:phosphoserine phosphatase
LEIIDGKLTGNIWAILLTVKRSQYLQAIAEKKETHINQTIAVGDGANDLPMLNLAGLGIAFHAKPTVKENASSSISVLAGRCFSWAITIGILIMMEVKMP